MGAQRINVSLHSAYEVAVENTIRFQNRTSTVFEGFISPIAVGGDYLKRLLSCDRRQTRVLGTFFVGSRRCAPRASSSRRACSRNRNAAVATAATAGLPPRLVRRLSFDHPTATGLD